MARDLSGVEKFLENIDCVQYWDIFKAKGFDRETDIRDLDESDLRMMDIPHHHAQIILAAAKTFEVSGEYRIQTWLEQWGLGYYLENFTINDFSDLQQIAKLDLDDPNVFGELEMDVPAHRKRLRNAVNQLRKKQKLHDVDDVVAMGTWCKPSSLSDARNDFLSVKATLSSTNNPAKHVSLDFMVDSGSDVNTLREEILQDLDLELIGTVQSHGIHASKQKQLYKALLRVGNVTILTEVIADTYDSLGNEVLRNFHHYINSSVHYWLLSDKSYLPPYMTSQPLSSSKKLY